MNQNIKVTIEIMANSQFIPYDTLALDKVQPIWVAEQFDTIFEQIGGNYFFDPCTNTE